MHMLPHQGEPDLNDTESPHVRLHWRWARIHVNMLHADHAGIELQHLTWRMLLLRNAASKRSER